jgi:uncharacterized membrane protein
MHEQTEVIDIISNQTSITLRVSSPGTSPSTCNLLACHRRQWVSLLLLLLAAVLCFFVLLTVSERFFCPALELISEYLRLPPVVAGATLLSFGNGAPDIFTQVAAVGQVCVPAS